MKLLSKGQALGVPSLLRFRKSSKSSSRRSRRQRVWKESSQRIKFIGVGNLSLIKKYRDSKLKMKSKWIK